MELDPLPYLGGHVTLISLVYFGNNISHKINKLIKIIWMRKKDILRERCEQNHQR